MTAHRTQQRKGVVLIVVLGILVVLSLLATTFATLQRIDRTVSHNYMDDVRAKLLAQSGVDYAITQIRGMMQQGMFSSGTVPWWQYWGNDVAETGTNPMLLQVPIELAKNPSWAVETTANPNDPAGQPKQINIKRPDGTIITVGSSGTMDSGTYAKYGDIYTLRCVDSSGMLYVNDGVYQYGGNTSSVSVNLRRMLNVLGSHSTVGIPNLGDLIISNRPPAGYTTKYELRKAVGYNEAMFNKFKDLVTTHAWVDKNVVNPVPLSSNMLPQYSAAGAPNFYRGSSTLIYRRGRGPNAEWQDRFSAEPLQWYQPGNSDLNHNAIYAQDELFPSYIEVVWRAPVNINAAPEPVLTAVIAGVSGFFSVERRHGKPMGGSHANFVYNGDVLGWPISCTVPQNWYTWWYSRYSYDAQRYNALVPSGNNSLTSDTGGMEGDETGHLYRTVDLVGPGGTSTGVSAITIAQAIMQCRANQGIYVGKPFAGQFKSWAQFNAFMDFLVQQGVITDTRAIYGNYVPNPSPTGTEQYQGAAAGSPNNLYAAQAAADALKANFNPNCHMNCTNPDKNLFTLVDKISLIVNSTEFSFVPMGYYEIESLGRVLRPQELVSGGTTGVDAYTSSGNDVVAEKKILVEVKIFDAYRETTQRHFYGGTLYPRSQSGLANVTNNNMSVEIGPEPDNGPLVYNDLWSLSSPMQTTPVLDGYAGYPLGATSQNTGWGYEYDGYLALPTLGGNWNASDVTTTKPKGTLWTTPSGPPAFGNNTIEAHFTYDFKAKYHASAVVLGDQFRDVVTHNYPSLIAPTYIDQILYTVPPKISKTVNYPDRGESNWPPYGPVDDPRYRLARSFRLPLQPSGSGTTSAGPPPALQEFAPSDLRLDGAYSERNSGLAYWMDQGVSWNEHDGIMATWIKPSFYPEFSGKVRKVFGMSRWHAVNFKYRNPNPWDLFYFPAHDTVPNSPSSTEYMAPSYPTSPTGTNDDTPIENVGGTGVNLFRPMSLNAIWGYWCFSGSGGDFNDWAPWLEEENYACTPTLNHNTHPGESALPNLMGKGKWTHVVMWWHEQLASSGGWFAVPTSQHSIHVLVDGSEPAGETHPYAGVIYNSAGRSRYFVVQSFSDTGSGHWLTNTIRLGECSAHGFGSYNRNFSGDFTFDEWYCWKDNGSTSMTSAINLWQWGRYYKPLWNNYSDSSFLSGSINLNQVAAPRQLPPPSTTATPPSTTGSSAGTGSTTTATTGAPQKRRLLGVCWTWYAEDYATPAMGASGPGKMVPIMYDYVNPYSPIPLFQTDTGAVSGNPQSCCRVFVLADGKTFPLSQPGGFTDDGWSKIVGSDGSPYAVTNPQDVKYKVWFQIHGLTGGSILLATPVFDDITLFYDAGDVEFLLYALVNTT